jgi:hypothetical protein
MMLWWGSTSDAAASPLARTARLCWSLSADIVSGGTHTEFIQRLGSRLKQLESDDPSPANGNYVRSLRAELDTAGAALH